LLESCNLKGSVTDALLDVLRTTSRYSTRAGTFIVSRVHATITGLPLVPSDPGHSGASSVQQVARIRALRTGIRRRWPCDCTPL